MLRSVYFAWLLLLCHTDINSARVSYPYIVSVKLRLKEEAIPKLIAESLFGNNPILFPYFDYSHVSLDDFEELIGTTEVTLKETFKQLDIQLDDFYYMLDRDAVLDVINIVQINIHHVYTKFLHYMINNPTTTIPKILNSLNINDDRFQGAVVYGSDKDLLNIFLEGSYSKKNIEKALEFVNHDVTLRQALNFIKAAKLEGLSKLQDSNTTVRLVKSLTGLITTNNAVNLLKALNVTSGDFYRSRAFNEVLNDLIDTNEELIGSLVSPEKIITMSYSKTLIDYEILKNFTGLVARAVENHGTQHIIADTEIPEYASVFTLSTIRKFDLHTYIKYAPEIEIENLKNCSYLSVSSSDNFIRSIRVTATLVKKDILKINKTSGMEFHVGSPLVCSGYLYGVAYWDYDSSISLLTLNSGAEPYTPSTSYVGTVVELVRQFPSLVVDRVCTVLRYFRLNVCSES